MVWLALHAWIWMGVAGRALLLLGALGPLGTWLTLLHMHHATTISKLPTDLLADDNLKVTRESTGRLSAV